MFGRIILLCFCFLSPLSGAKEPLVFVIIDGSQNNSVYNLANEVLKEIGSRMKVETKLVSLPPLRAEASFKNGEIDAELARVASYQHRMPSAIRVDEIIMTAPLHAFSRDTDIEINGWQSIKPYKIVTVRGYVFAETHLAEHDNYFVDSHEVGFHFIESGRADLFICSDIIAKRVLASPDFKNSSVKRLQPPVAFTHSYTFFAKGLEKEAQAFEQALKSMKADGTYKKLFAKIK